jgi:hypothetical protein
LKRTSAALTSSRSASAIVSRALQALAAEHVGDPAHGLFHVEGVAVRGGDARRLLASMLERVQAEVGDVGGLLVIPDAEKPAFIVELVVEIERRRLS